MSNSSDQNPLNWLLLFSLTLIWGTSYILIKKSLIGFTAVELACLRISLSCIAALPLIVKAVRSVPRKHYFTLLQVGVFGSGLPAFLFSLSLTRSGSAITGILNSLSPLWTLIIGYYLYKVTITSQKVWGVIIGFVGALVLVLGRGGGMQVDIIYSILPVVATFCYGLSTNITKQRLQNENPIYTTAIAMVMIGIPALIGLSFTAVPAKIISGQVWMSFACACVLAVVGTLIAWMLFYKLVQRTDALFAASVTYLVPIIAISWGLLDGEVLSPVQLIGFALIIAGVYFTTRKAAIARN